MAKMNSIFTNLILKSFDINPARLKMDDTGEDGYESMMTRYMTYLNTADAMLARYREYDEMDEYSTDVSTMLDKVSREGALMNRESGNIVWFTSKNPTIETYCNKMIKRLSLEKHARTYLRYIGKYGRFIVRPMFLDRADPKIEWLDDDLHHEETINVEDLYYRSVETYYSSSGEWKGFRRKNNEYKHWEFIEFKIGAGRWGNSMLEGVRYLWRSLDLLEKALELFRIAKSPQINIYRVPIGNADPLESLGILKMYKKFIEQQTRSTAAGHYKQAKVPTPLTSIYFPISDKNDGAGIDVHSNNADIRKIEDIEYKHDKLLRKLGLPLKDEYDPTKNLSSTSVDVASRVEDLQLAFMEGIDRMAQIELALLGIPVDEDTYEIHMSRPSDLEETLRLEKLQLGIAVATDLFELGGTMVGESSNPLEEATPPKAWQEYVVNVVLHPYFGDMMQGYEEYKQEKEEEQSNTDQAAEKVRDNHLQYSEQKLITLRPIKRRDTHPQANTLVG